jgi:hypothetical protein
LTDLTFDDPDRRMDLVRVHVSERDLGLMGQDGEADVPRIHSGRRFDSHF